MVKYSLEKRLAKNVLCDDLNKKYFLDLLFEKNKNAFESNRLEVIPKMSIDLSQDIWNREWKFLRKKIGHRSFSFFEFEKALLDLCREEIIKFIKKEEDIRIL